MELTTCTDCNGKVSKRAHHCPNCGGPTENTVSKCESSPLRSINGIIPTLTQQDPLSGICPECADVSKFKPLSGADLLNLFGQLGRDHGFKNGLVLSLINDAANLLRGHKIPLCYRCQSCRTPFYVCRDCMRPTRLNINQRQRYCDYCEPDAAGPTLPLSGKRRIT